MDDRDIYSKPPPAPPPEPVVYPEVDVTPRVVRAVTLKRIVYSVMLISLFLGLAVLIFLYVEQRGEREDLEDLTDEELAELLPRRAGRGPRDLELPALPPPPDALNDLPPADLEPARVAEAMGHVRVARQHAREQQWDQAEAHARQALGVWPDMADAYSLLGFIFTNRGQFEQAERLLMAALKADPFNAEVYNTLAAVYMQQGEHAKAEDLLHAAIDLREDFLPAYANLGMLYILLGNYEWAADQFERILNAAPDNHDVRNNLGVCLIRMGRYRDAQRHFQYLIDQMPRNASFYFNMAITYTEQRDYDAALEWIKQAAAHCSAVEFQHFMNDPDFDEMRERSDFKDFRNALFPDAPVRLEL